MTTARRLLAISFAAALACGSGLARASAESTPGTSPQAGEVRLAVTFSPRFATPLERSEIVGELDLFVLPGDKISGFYRPESDRSAIPLTGASTPSGTFVDVGDGFQEFHLEGTLTAEAGRRPSYVGSARIGNDAYDMNATSCRDARGRLSILCQ